MQDRGDEFTCVVRIEDSRVREREREGVLGERERDEDGDKRRAGNEREELVEGERARKK